MKAENGDVQALARLKCAVGVRVGVVDRFKRAGR